MKKQYTFTIEVEEGQGDAVGIMAEIISTAKNEQTQLSRTAEANKKAMEFYEQQMNKIRDEYIEFLKPFGARVWEVEKHSNNCNGVPINYSFSITWNGFNGYRTLIPKDASIARREVPFESKYVTFLGDYELKYPTIEDWAKRYKTELVERYKKLNNLNNK